MPCVQERQQRYRLTPNVKAHTQTLERRELRKGYPGTSVAAAMENDDPAVVWIGLPDSINGQKPVGTTRRRLTSSLDPCHVSVRIAASKSRSSMISWMASSCFSSRGSCGLVPKGLDIQPSNLQSRNPRIVPCLRRRRRPCLFSFGLVYI